MTDQIHKWEKTQRQKRKRKINIDVDRKLENTPLQGSSTDLTSDQSLVVEEQLDSFADDKEQSVTDQEPSTACPDDQQEGLSNKLSQSDRRLSPIPKKSWKEEVLEVYKTRSSNVTQVKTSFWDAKKRITGKPQYEVCADDGELGILRIIIIIKSL